MSRAQDDADVIETVAAGRTGVRQRRWLGRIAGAAALVMPGAAFAQCVDTTGFAGPSLAVLAGGASINAIISTVNTLNSTALNQTTGFITAPGGAAPGQQHGGVWTRAFGGSVDSQNNGVSTFTALPGSVVCDTDTRLEFDGYQAGVDLGRLNLGGGTNLFVGVTAGHVGARARDRTIGLSTFRGSTDVPFAGIYGALTSGNFYMDGQLRWDFYEHRITEASANAFGMKVDGRGFSVSGSAGYRFDLGSNAFLETSVAGSYSTVRTNAIQMLGPIFAGGLIQVGEIESILGRASLRLGTNFVRGAMAWQPFITASVYHEFSDDVTSTTTDFFGVGFGTATLATDRVGTFFQLGAGISGAVIDTGWVGYARIDYRTGDQVEGISANAGLRYHFDPEKAVASLKDGPSGGTMPYNWTGIYLGVHGGAVVGDMDGAFTSAPALNPYNPGFAGWLLGGQVGYNYQMAHWVIGIEGDIGRSNASGGGPCPNGFFFTCEAELQAYSTFTGRLGVLWERALIYAKAGVAAGRVRAQTHFNPNTPVGVPPQATHGESKTLVGWTVGGGFEFALTDRWTARAEYMHVDLGSGVFDVFSGNPCCFADLDTTADTVRVGLNMKLFKD